MEGGGRPTTCKACKIASTGWPAEDAREVASLLTPELRNSAKRVSSGSCVDKLYDVDKRSLACRNDAFPPRRGWHSYTAAAMPQLS